MIIIIIVICFNGFWKVERRYPLSHFRSVVGIIFIIIIRSERCTFVIIFRSGRRTVIVGVGTPIPILVILLGGPGPSDVVPPVRRHIICNARKRQSEKPRTLVVTKR